MKKIVIISIVLLYCFISGCQPGKNNTIHAQQIPVDTAMLDSIKANADSVYTKEYPRTDLVTAEYFVNHKDSTITQVMKDIKGTIRQVIVEKNKIRIYFAKFYPNGQMVAKYYLDNFGQYNDSSKEFFENGFLKSEGIYKNGLHSGKWKNFDSTGSYISTNEYNQNGQQIKSTE